MQAMQSQDKLPAPEKAKIATAVTTGLIKLNPQIFLPKYAMLMIKRYTEFYNSASFLSQSSGTFIGIKMQFKLLLLIIEGIKVH